MKDKLNEENPWIAFHFIDGKSLKNANKDPMYRRYLEWHGTALWNQLSSVLQLYTERTSKVHLDIKPGNIMVQIRNQEAVYIVIDFGMALEVDSRRIGGTAMYKYSDTVSSPIEDIYATVVTIIEMANTYPFKKPYFKRSNGTTLFNECFEQKSNNETQIPIEAEDFKTWYIYFVTSNILLEHRLNKTIAVILFP